MDRVRFIFSEAVGRLKKSLKRHVLTEEIYRLLKDQLMNHAIAPGEKINIDQLSRELEVSNIPIREALSRLASEGFVHTVPFKGMFAAQMSRGELDDIYEIRKELERLAIRKAAPRIPAPRLTELERNMRTWYGLRPADGDGKIRLIGEMNRGLHGLILEYCGNETLKKLISMYIEKIQRYLSYVGPDLDQGVIEKEWQEHMRIAASLSSGRFEAAERDLLEHLDRSHARTRAFFS